MLLAQSAQAGLFTREWTWPRVLTLVRERFADVTHISTAELARKLAARGYTNVVNLEGSLFAWANEGRPVYAGGQLASRVHPYDSAWGGLLRPGLRPPSAP